MEQNPLRTDWEEERGNHLFFDPCCSLRFCATLFFFLLHKPPKRNENKKRCVCNAESTISGLLFNKIKNDPKQREWWTTTISQELYRPLEEEMGASIYFAVPPNASNVFLADKMITFFSK